MANATPRRLEVMPYVVTKNVSQPATPTGWDHPQQQSAGLDLKVGLTSNITVDATINPDFGQVEADPAVLNLSAFEIRFDERRPFFQEGGQSVPLQRTVRRHLLHAPRGPGAAAPLRST